ncbi:sugar ABC transporter substrate-binding protein [Arthrobacter sp. 135MFCol5.1]|uniref:sugar ABC transporter substrate-binding protein n=1 Tax=Arthrobacter sp. 135MFCol5.1 TaxID=1158050 RepID=UPI0009D9E6AC|nr:sugar ABC transporter substrate-binding protein [Arthrobacter sp. 135MFCol5.1]
MKWFNTNRKAVAPIALASAVTVICLSSCSSAAPGAGATAASGSCSKVTALVNDLQNPWNATLAQGMTEQAAKLGVNLTVQNAAGVIATQASQLQQAVTSKPDGILLQATESNGLVPAVKIANRNSVPVATVNANVGQGADVVTFVGVDQKDYGIALAKLVEEALPNGGNVAIIQGVVGNPVEIDRTEGITETFAANPSIKIATTVTDSWNNADNLAAVQDLLAKYPKGTLDAVVAEGPEMYVGAQYAASIGRDDVKFIAGDFPIEVQEAIKAGHLYGTILQDGATIGARSLEDLCAHVTGKSVPTPTDFIDLPSITSKNVADFKTSWHW